MKRWSVLAVLAALTLAPIPALAAPTAEDMSYTAPACPEPPSVGPMVLRLAAATVASLGLCAGVLWLARRGLLGAPPTNANGRLLPESTLPLGGGSHLFLLQADGQRYVVGVGRGVLQTLTPLHEPFEQALSRADCGLRIADRTDDTA
jgi:hypothetical protein